MRGHITEFVNSAVQNPKVAGAILATAPVSTTLTTYEMIPVLFGYVTTIVTLIGAFVVIYVNIKQHLKKMEIMAHDETIKKLEIWKIKKELDE